MPIELEEIPAILQQTRTVLLDPAHLVLLIRASLLFVSVAVIVICTLGIIGLPI